MRFLAFAASVLALALLAGCGDDDDESAPEDRSTGLSTVESSTPMETLPAPAILKVYLLLDGKVNVAGRKVVAGPAVGRAALVELLEGPTDAERARGLSSDIPPGTKVEDLTIDEDQTAVVELSQSLNEAATAQVVYTLTQFLTVKRVRLEGEGHVRTDFEAQTPPILVESPLPGEDVTSPLRIEGTANTFEATFHADVLDARGRLLGQHVVTATSGSGQRGTFAANVTFAGVSGRGALVTYELSAEDGSRMHETEVPLLITPR